MKIPNKQKLQQIVFDHSSDINFRDFMTLYQKKYCRIIFLFSDTALTSDTPLRNNLPERI